MIFEPGWMAIELETPIGQRQCSFAGLCGLRLHLLSESSSVPYHLYPMIKENPVSSTYYLYCFPGPRKIDMEGLSPECLLCLVNIAEKLHASYEADQEYLKAWRSK